MYLEKSQPCWLGNKAFPSLSVAFHCVSKGRLLNCLFTTEDLSFTKQMEWTDYVFFEVLVSDPCSFKSLLCWIHLQVSSCGTNPQKPRSTLSFWRLIRNKVTLKLNQLVDWCYLFLTHSGWWDPGASMDLQVNLSSRLIPFCSLFLWPLPRILQKGLSIVSLQKYSWCFTWLWVHIF